MQQGIDASEGPSRLSPEGELTIYNARAFRDELSAALDEHHGLELDLSRVTELDTAALQVILAALRTARTRGIPLDICNISPSVRDLLGLYGLEFERAGRV